MLSSSDILALAGDVATLLLTAYAAYWAFDTRKAFAVQLYRNQALGIGLVALSFSSAFIVTAEINLTSLLNLPALSHYWPVPLYFSFMLLFYWIDTSARAARRSDPLLRDTLNWMKIRSLLWALNFTLIILYLSAASYDLIFPVSASLAPLIVPIGILPIFIALISGSLLLPISARRSRDMALRKHLEWFGLFAFFSLLATSISASTYPYHHVGLGLLAYAALPAGSYCLYRSAKSLAPLNRIS